MVVEEIKIEIVVILVVVVTVAGKVLVISKFDNEE